MKGISVKQKAKMDQATKQQVIDRLHEATNVMVTVSNNPSVDQLAACIGLALFLNKVEKRGTAVFSGKVPSTLEFLKPEKTIEKTTDSLRDFIISLDKSKADKLRYKVEDQVVKIFITPYRTNLSEKDLEFSQGDFNIDVVMALGVHRRGELDQAIVAHGRILHDATVISVNNRQQGDVGSLNWVDLNASSLCEMMVDLADEFSRDNIDGQIATALLTGIVAETARFSNEKTTPRTMTLASQLMSAGANQQLIATQLEGPDESKDSDDRPKNNPGGPGNPPKRPDKKPDDGSLKIEHAEPEEREEKSGKAEEPLKPAPMPGPADELPRPVGDDRSSGGLHAGSGMILEPPILGGKLTANTEPEHMQFEPPTDILGPQPAQNTLLDRKPAASSQPATLEEIEDSLPAVHHVKDMPTPYEPSPSEPAPPKPESKEEPKEAEKPETEPGVSETKPSEGPKAGDDSLEEAREAVAEAIQDGGPDKDLEPIAALGAQTVDLNLDHAEEENKAEEPSAQAAATLPAPVLPPGIPAQTQPVANQAIPQFTPPSPLPVAAAVPPQPAATVFAPTQPLAGPGMSTPYMPPIPATPVAASVPPGLIPNNPPSDPTAAASAAPAPPPVPPPMMPPPPPPVQ